MDVEEADGLTECWGCNATVSGAEDRVYAFGELGVLCFECAVRRGGTFDAKQERWVRAPNLSGLRAEPFSEQRL
jgi:hypothetical protein